MGIQKGRFRVYPTTVTPAPIKLPDMDASTSIDSEDWVDAIPNTPSACSTSTVFQKSNDDQKYDAGDIRFERVKKQFGEEIQRELNITQPHQIRNPKIKMLCDKRDVELAMIRRTGKTSDDYVTEIWNSDPRGDVRVKRRRKLYKEMVREKKEARKAVR